MKEKREVDLNSSRGVRGRELDIPMRKEPRIPHVRSFPS
jgi:hypothetical protein